MLSEARPTQAVLSQQGAVAEAAESAPSRFVGALSLVLPAAMLVQAVVNLSDYLQPAVPVLVWLGMLAVAGWLVPRACARGLSAGEVAAALVAAVAAVAAVGADHRPVVDAAGVNWAIVGTVGLLALIAQSHPARVWVPGAVLTVGVHAVFVDRSLGGSPLGQTRVVAGAYAAFIVPGIFAALRPAMRTRAAVAVRRISLASRVAAERAAVTAVQRDRRERLALLQAEAFPLLSGIAAGSLDPADGAVRERCARNAAILRQALADRAGPAGGLLAALAPELDAARSRGVPVAVQVIGDVPTAGPEVARASAAAAGLVLRHLPGPPATLTILVAGDQVELYLTFGPGVAVPRGPDLAALGRAVPPEAGWSATAESGGGVPGCLEIRWRRGALPR